VPKIVQSRRGYSRRKGQAELGHKRVKRLADGLWAYTAAFRKREQWLIGFTAAAVAFLYVVPKACRQLGPERHKPTLTEFCVANKQRVLPEIEIFQFQTDRFANTQTKAVQEGEYHLVRLRPMRGTRPVRERTSQLQKTLSVIEIEQIGNAFASIAAPSGVHWIVRDEPLHHRPFEKTMEHTEQMVVTARPRPRA
jgi:hypothetical protein